jgi:pimeloyl-ACP methyl ester carboxylesterase
VTTTTALTPGAHTIEIDGVGQRYHVAGSGPVCLVHSGGPGIGWEYLRMPALEPHLTLVYLEPVGTGGSGRLADPRRYTLDLYARFVHGVIEHIGLSRVNLIGHSHGGFVAQTYALAHPERLAGLVLHATSPVTGEEFWADAVANLDAFARRHPDRAEVPDVVAALPEALAAQTDEGFTDAFRRLFPVYFADYWRHGRDLAALRAGVRAWIDPMRGEEPTPFDVRDALTGLAVPTLVVAGAYDFICGPRWCEMIHRAVPDSRLVRLDDSGHMGHLEEPDAFARAVLDLVRDQAPVAMNASITSR